jgi:hypothetical protein
MLQCSIVCVATFWPYAVTSTSTLKQDGLSIVFDDKTGLLSLGKIS